MRWRANIIPSFEDQIEWHEWFAWYPVVVDYEYSVWLETIERRRAHGMTPYGPYPLKIKWDYRPSQAPETHKVNG